MDVIYPRCCGLDVHKKSVVACVLLSQEGARPRKEVRTFGTMTRDLLELSDWLASFGVTHVAMESTGSYWKPVYNLLEDRFNLLLVNAHHFKQVPGRKTDVRDSEWLADLLRHGLLKASFVPERPQRELRELTRYRTSLIRERTAEVNRLQKVLEGANIKLAAVATNILSQSARDMLCALIAGESDPAVLAQLAKGRLRAKLPQLEAALEGSFGPHQRFVVAQQLAHIDELEDRIERVDQEVAERLRPFEAVVERLDTATGVGRRIAEVVLAEVGPRVTEQFPSYRQLSSWAGMCPGHKQSAGKNRSGKMRHGNPWLRTALLEAARAAVRKKDSYCQAQYQRLAARRGGKRAIMAVGHSLLVAIFHILRDEVPYQELGAQYFDERDRQGVAKRCVRRLERLGYTVQVQELAAAA